MARRQWNILFVIPENFAPRRAQVRALMANDYRIEVAQQHPFFDALRNQFTPAQHVL